MIEKFFTLVLSALFLMGMFWILWYVAVPLLAVIVVVSAAGVLIQKLNRKTFSKKSHCRSIHADDVIDVDFKEIK